MTTAQLLMGQLLALVCLAGILPSALNSIPHMLSALFIIGHVTMVHRPSP